jgi:hypothetical protein
MANSNFVVQNGLTVGPLTIDAATGDIATTGNIAIPTNPATPTSATSKSYVDSQNAAYGVVFGF